MKGNAKGFKPVEALFEHSDELRVTLEALAHVYNGGGTFSDGDRETAFTVFRTLAPLFYPTGGHCEIAERDTPIKVGGTD